MPSKSSNPSKDSTSDTPALQDGASTAEPGEMGLMADAAGDRENPGSDSLQGSVGSSAALNSGTADDADAGEGAETGSTTSEETEESRGRASRASAATAGKTRGGASQASDKGEKRKNKGEKQMNENADQEKSGLSEMADQVKTAASGVATAVGDKAQNMVSGVSDEFEHVINERKDQSAEGLHRLADAITRAGGELQEEFPVVADYVKRGASKLDTLAEAIRHQDGRQLASQAADVVRRRAGTVAAIMGLAGFVAVRFLMARPGQSSAVNGAESSGDQEGGSGGRGTNKTVQQALERLAETHDGSASGDPDGVSPVAPGFEKTDEPVSGTS